MFVKKPQINICDVFPDC